MNNVRQYSSQPCPRSVRICLLPPHTSEKVLLLAACAMFGKNYLVHPYPIDRSGHCIQPQEHEMHKQQLNKHSCEMETCQSLELVCGCCSSGRSKVPNLDSQGNHRKGLLEVVDP